MVGQMQEWLDDLGLGQYASAFKENDIDAEILVHLSDQDLEKLGIASLGHRKRILQAIAHLPAATEAPADKKERLRTSAEGERRQVTVLFADISDFTRLSSELGAEATHDLLNHYFAAVDGIVHQYDGSIDKHIGDAVMAVFGAPIAHEDDPVRAARAALDIHRAVAEVGGKLGRTLQVHVGIASGEVVASGTGSDAHREYTVTGDTVNLASRLDGLAESGQTLVSDAVWRALAGCAEGRSLGDVKVKGLDRAVPVWQLQGLTVGRPIAAGSQLMGRRAELNQFAGILDACRETEGGHAVYVRGDAGIGKTRLAEEFQAMAEAQGFACHTGLVLDFGAGKGQDAIRTLVRSLIDLPRGADEVVRASAAEHTIAADLIREEQRIFLNDLLDLAQPVELRAIYDAMENTTRNRGKWATVVELVKRLSAARALCLRVEDLHWADPIVLAHLAELAAAIADCRAILIMTSRFENDPMDSAWRSALRGCPHSTIDLGPLRESEAQQLARVHAGADPRFVATCIKRAEGNPLFLEQLLRSADVSSEAQLPGSLQSVVLARMDRLNPRDKQALQAASVVGQRFTLDLLRDLIEQPRYDGSGLVEQYLVRPQGDELLFAHALIQEGVYNSLLEERRHELHRRAAAWYGERDLGLHAEHLDRAGDLTAPQAYLAAASQQVEQAHVEVALRLVERGLELARDRSESYRLTALHGQVLHDLGRIEPSIEAYERALGLADDDIKRCRAWIGQVAGMRIVDRYDDALTILDRAQPVAERADLSAELAQIHNLRGNIYFPLGNVEGCLEQQRLALDYATAAGSLEDEARALSGLADAHYVQGRMIMAHDHFDRCVRLCRQYGFSKIEVGSLGMRGLTRLFQNDLQGCVEDRLTAAESAARIGDFRAELVARGGLIQIFYEMGELDSAREQGERALELAGLLGARRFEPMALFASIRLLVHNGNCKEARELAQRAIVISRETGIKFIGPIVLGVGAEVETDPATRLAFLDEGEAVLQQGCASHNYFYFCNSAIVVALEMRDWDRVLRYAAILEDYTRPEPLPWSNFFIARGRALAAHGRGRRDEALTAELQRLRDEAAQIGFKMALTALEKALTKAKQDGHAAS